MSARVVGLVGASPRKVSTVRAAHSSARAIVLGERTAPVKVVVYEDFGCRRCYEFEEASRDFLHAAAALKVEPAEAIVLEDSLNGMRAAHAAGMRCIVVPCHSSDAM